MRQRRNGRQKQMVRSNLWGLYSSYHLHQPRQQKLRPRKQPVDVEMEGLHISSEVRAFLPTKDWMRDSEGYKNST